MNSPQGPNPTPQKKEVPPGDAPANNKSNPVNPGHRPPGPKPVPGPA